LFVDATKRRGLAGFWLERGWIGDVSNFAYTKRKCVSDFCGKLGGVGFRGVYWFICDIGGMSRVVGWPNTDTNSFLVSCRDLKFGVGNKGIEGVVPPDKEPGVVDEFKG
jgi:hypothetical protein